MGAPNPENTSIRCNMCVVFWAGGVLEKTRTQPERGWEKLLHLSWLLVVPLQPDLVRIPLLATLVVGIGKEVS